MNPKNIVQGFGFASVELIVRLWPHLSRYHPIVYHSFLPMRTVVWGVLIDLLVISLLAAWLFHLLERNPTGWRTVLWPFVAAALAASVATALTTMHRGAIPWLNADGAYGVVLVGSLLMRWTRPLAFQRAVRTVSILLVLAGCSMVWMLPELLFQALRKQPSDAAARVRNPQRITNASSALIAAQPRIVWLIFDELSYDQTFEHRWPGLALPAFDRLQAESTSFSNVQPAGYYTERVIPSLLMGRRVDRVRSDLDGVLALQLGGSDQWRPFDPRATLFADAQRLGWTTGVAGWYNPYCRMLASAVDWCYWRMADGQSDGALPDRSILQNAMAPLAERWRALQHGASFPQQRHAEDLNVLMPEALALIGDENIRFLLIHLPVPHPPVIYDRHSGRMDGGKGYLDNLALADRSLGQLMAAVQATTASSATTIIVCSDHSWRIPMWRSSGEWTREDEAASHGRFDPRPVLMIHVPGQTTKREVSTPFDAIRLHEIIEELLAGRSY